MSTCGTLTVNPALDPDNLSMSCNLETRSTLPGGSVQLTVTVTNDNAVAAVVDIEVRAEGPVTEVIQSDPGVSVPAGDQVTRDYSVLPPETPGDYSVKSELVNVTSSAPVEAARRTLTAGATPPRTGEGCLTCGSPGLGKRVATRMLRRLGRSV